MGQIQPNRTAEVNNMQTLVDQGADYKTPIRNAYARAQHQNARSYNNPLGGFTTADVRDKSIRSQNADFQQNLGIDLSNAAQANADSKFQKQAAVAGFTQPQIYNASSVQKTSDPWGTALGFAGAGSSLATGLMGGSKK
jgi:hypothetical protein